jgi:hypothetical protein
MWISMVMGLCDEDLVGWRERGEEIKFSRQLTRNQEKDTMAAVKSL